MNEMVNERQLVERLAEEFVERYRAGERPSPDEYAAAHPQHAEEIRELFPALVLIEELAPSEDNSGGAPTPAVAAAAPPARVGDFRILREIGRGGMGIVYEAEQESLGRHVALKVLHVQPGQDVRVLARFRRESRAAAQLHHTNIVPVFEVGQEGGVCYYAMQFIQGQALDQVLNELQRLRSAASVVIPRPLQANTGAVARSLWTGQFEPTSEGHLSRGADASGTLTLDARGVSNHEVPRSPAAETDRVALDATLSSVESNYRHFCHNVARLGLQAADALAYAHGRGIIHRDIKPANLLLDTNGVLWVSDFGLAKTQDPALTDTGDLLGTLRYMAPERFKGECDTRADVYALGLTLYELLVLRPAFDGADRLHLVEQIGHQEPARLRTLDPRIPRDLETIIMKAIEKDPRRRYVSAEAMAGDLRRFLADEPILARRTGPLERLGRWGRRNPLVASLSAAIVLVAALGFVGVFGQLQVAVAHEQQANANAAEAKQKEKEANQQRDEVKALNEQLQAALKQLQATQDKLQRTLYAAHMNLAQRAWDDADVSRVLTLLDQHRTKAGEQDLRGFEWHYLNKLCNPDHLLTIKVPMSMGNATFSTDGKRVFALRGAGTKSNFKGDGKSERVEPELKAFDVQTGQELLSFTLTGGEREVILSPNGKFVASAADFGKTVKVWDVQTGKVLHSLKRGSGGSVVPKAAVIVFSPDSNQIASPIGNETKIWDAQTGQELRILQGHTEPVLSVAFSQDGKRLVSSSGDWDKLGKFTLGQVKAWDVQTGKELFALKSPSDPVWNVSFNSDGKRLLTVSEEAKVWDGLTGKELFSVKGQSGGLSAVSFSPDGQRLVAADEDSKAGRIRVWDAQTAKLLFTFQGHTSWVQMIAFTPDGSCLASLGSDQTLRIWDLQTGREIGTLRGVRQPSVGNGLAFSPDGKRLVIGDGGQVKVWEWEAQKNQQNVNLKGISVSGTRWISDTYVALSPDFKQVAGVSGYTVKVWDAQTGQETVTLKGLTNRIVCVAFSPDGKRVAACDGATSTSRVLDAKAQPVPGAVKVWDAQTGQELLSLKGHTDSVGRVAFSPDGKRLATASWDKTVKVWDAQTGKELLSLTLKEQKAGPAPSVSFSPDGKRLGGDGKVWDAQTGEELLSLAWPGPVTFSPDGKRLLSFAGPLKVWDAQTGELLFPLNVKAGTIIVGPSGASSAVFSPDGKRLAAASGGHVKLWDLQTGQELLSLKVPRDINGVIAFSPDGYRLGHVTVGGTVTIWDATPLPEKR